MVFPSITLGDSHKGGLKGRHDAVSGHPKMDKKEKTFKKE
ncbi:hypothetical protein CV83915_2p0271 (plasmid) [Escherichia coli]|uniref:Uncharacterized protein n=2 Tax=Escherichia coli TaxID=562 RepID=A0A2H4TL77_ECOLX|nr:hypothetical protein J444_pB131 [Escherichia coli ACN001]ATZ30274.1 hypothetical protein CV83915_2p0271 [Escherichia coli]QQZ47954.1 hypothetical protein [Escherichia coli]